MIAPTAERALSPRESLAVGVIAAVAASRTLVAISPALRFDADPAVIPGALAGIGPGASLLLDAIAMAALAILVGTASARGRPLGLSPWLALLPIPAFVIAALWGDGGIGDTWRGASWVTAPIAAAVVAGRGAAARTIVGAVLLGAVAAMIVRGASQVLVEHPAMVAHFDANRESFLAARGWNPGSPAALAYERRLRQVEASGWFGLANVYSGVMLAGGLALAGVAWSARRTVSGGEAASGGRSTPALLCAVASLAAISLVAINGSKGAIATLVVAVMAAVVLARTRGRGAGLIPWLLCSLALAGAVSAIVRGAIFGESAMAERSLLFRWHYLVGALRMLAAEPLRGIGAGGFQEAYLVARPWMSPEEVMSAHAAWADWLAAFGVGAAGLVMLSIELCRRGLRGAVGGPAPGPGDSAPAVESGRPVRAPSLATVSTLSAAGGAALALALTSRSDLDAASLSIRVVAALAAAVTAWCAATLMERADRVIDRSSPHGVERGLAVGALALLIHGQVDMDFWHPGSAWWCWLLLAAAAASRAPRRRPIDAALRPLLVAIAVLAAAWLAVGGLRLGAQERALERAARLIEIAVAAGEAPPRAPAAALLEQAAEIEPSNELVWQAAVEQQLMAADRLEPRTAARIALVERSVALADDAFAARPCAATARLRMDAHHRRAIERFMGIGSAPPPDAGSQPRLSALSNDERRALVEAASEYLRRDPRSIAGWAQRAEIELLLDDPAAASRAARRALEVDASYALDPLRRLNDRDRERLTTIARSPAAESPQDPSPQAPSTPARRSDPARRRERRSRSPPPGRRRR